MQLFDPRRSTARIAPDPGNILILLSTIALLCSFSQQGVSQPLGSHGSFKPTEAQLAALPAYCRARVLPQDHPEARNWASMLGEGWNHIHHYCLALQALDLARVSMSDRERQRAFSRAQGEIQYVVKRVSPNYPLMPELLLNRARAEHGSGNSGLAIVTLQDASARKPDYIAPYFELAEVYLQMNQPEEARKTLITGLAKNPNSRSLQRRLDCLENPGGTQCH